MAASPKLLAHLLKLNASRIGVPRKPSTIEKLKDRVGAKNPNWKGSKKEQLCIQCGKPFFTYRATRIFCSHICANSNQEKKLVMRSHGLKRKNETACNWQGGKTLVGNAIKQSYLYRDFRNAVLLRDNYTCQFCGIRGGKLHVDHIRPFAYFPELRLEVSNGRTLCIPCHRKTPTWGRRKFCQLELV